MAAAALARAGHADALTSCASKLRSDDRLIRNTVAFALARLGGAFDIEPLEAALDSETDVLSRAILVNALASLGQASSRKALRRNLDADRCRRAHCFGRVCRPRRCFECQAKLIRLLEDSTLDTRVRAAQSLIALSLPAPKR